MKLKLKNKKLLEELMRITFYLLIFFLPSFLVASSVNTWVQTTYRDFEDGKMTNCLISLDGFIEGGPSLEKVHLNIDAINSSLTRTKTKYYFGSKNKIYKFEDEKLTPIFEKEGTIFNSFLKVGNIIYASSSPNGEIFKINKDDKIEPFVKLPCKYVWKMVERGGIIYATCGMDGNLFEIKESSFSSLFELKGTNITAITLDSKNNIIFGTYPTGAIYSLDNKENKRVLIQFEDSEIMSLVSFEDYIYVGVNHYKMTQDEEGENKEKDQEGQERILERTPISFSIYRLTQGGESELILFREKEFVTDIKIAKNKTLFAATGPRGKIYKMNRENDKRKVSFFSLDDEIVTNINQFTDEILSFSTSNMGNLYKWNRDKDECIYTSDVLDTENNSKWGKIYWSGGSKITIQTRSGETNNPDEYWSAWSSKLHNKEGEVPSKGGRFFQYMANIPIDERLESLRLFYIGKNRKPILGKIFTTFDNLSKEEIEKKSSRIKGEELSKHTVVTLQNIFNVLKEHQNYLKIMWDGFDPDGDQLNYQLFYKMIDEANWKKMTNEPIKETSYTWRTDILPDGYYVIKIVASDLRNNTFADFAQDEGTSEEFLIDNSKPSIKGLEYKDGVLKGTAFDSASPIIRIEYSINGRKWRVLYPEDGFLDSKEEKFNLTIGKIKKGEITISVRAFDVNWNLGIEKVRVTLR